MKRTRRWVVLERDNFTCRYCGRSAPDVVLEVDHVESLALGGADVIENLVTACFDCNRGKRWRDATEALIGRDWISSLRDDVTALEGLVDAGDGSLVQRKLDLLVLIYAEAADIDTEDVYAYLDREVI